MCRACINAAFWHFVCQSGCIHSLRRLVAEDTTFSAKQAEETYTYISMKEVNNISIDINSYCCRITIKRVDRIGPVRVGHVTRELPRFVFYFIQEGGSVTGIVASTTPRISPITKGGLEVPILLYIIRENKAIYSKMEILVRKQVEKLKKTFDVETLAEENFSENSPEENLTCAEEDEEKEEKEQAEEDVTIEVESDGEEKE